MRGGPEKAPEALPVRLERHRIYLLPTGYGVGFGLILAAMLLGAINYHNNQAFLLTFLLIGIVLVSILHTYRNLEGITVSAMTASAVFAGDPARFAIRLAAGGSPRRAVRLTLDKVAADPVDLAANLESAVEIAVPTVRRGLLEVKRLTVSSRYPLGLFRAWSPLQPGAVGLVYPRPIASAIAMGQSATASGNRGRPEAGAEDFEGLNAYQPGDEPRKIHWKGYARGQGLHTKHFAAPAGGFGLLDWFALPETDPEKKIGMLCHAVLAAERRKAPYGLRLPGTLVAPSAGATHRHRCLKALAQMPHADSGGLP